MEKNDKTQNKFVQTYTADIAGVIEDDKSGLIKKIIHGEEEAEKEKINLSPQSKKNKLFMLVSIVLVAVALTIISFFFFNKGENTVEIGNQFVPIIFNDKSSFVETAGLSKDEIAQTIANKVESTEVKSGGVEGIYITENKSIVELRRFLALMKASLVPNDNNTDASLVSDHFLMGAVNSTTKNFFMILRVRTLSDIFVPLRDWESKMFLDLHGLFGIDISPETKYLLTANFEDGLVANKNARILYEKEGAQDREIALMYIFADDNSIIITNNENAAREIILRLAGSQIKK